MSSAERKYSKSIKLNPILIYKQDLSTLEHLLKTALSGEDNISVTVSTEYDNTNIEAKSVDDFLLVEGLPDKIGRLDIYIYCSGKVIYIMLGDYRMFLSVSGKDETWVLGTFHQLSLFFANKKPWFRSRKMVVFAIGILVGLLTSTTPYLYAKGHLISAVIFSIIILYSYSAVFIGHFDKYFPSFELRLSHKTIIDKEMIIIILTASILIVAIIGVVLPLLLNK
jgi:hypothetical protein